MTVNDIYKYIDSIAPFSSQEEWDNSGLLVGSGSSEVKKVYVCLDVTNKTADEAIKIGAHLVVSHHPIIFNPISTVEAESPLCPIIKSGISVISAHTNLDIAEFGVNKTLCDLLGLKESFESDCSFIRFCEPDNYYTNAGVLARHCADVLNCSASVCNPENKADRIAVCAGAGGSFIKQAAAGGADVLITGEAKYHEFNEAQQFGIALITLGHYETEYPIVPVLRDSLAEEFPEAEIFCAGFDRQIVTVN